MIKEVEVIRTMEVIKEVPVEIIKEVEVVKSFDFEELQKMMMNMGTVEVSRTEKKGIAKKASKVVAKKASTKKKAVGTTRAKKDDLKKVEGIGPKIEGLLHAAKITTFKKLSETKISVIRGILEKAGPRYQMHDPSTWAKQASMAAKGDWTRLQKWQDELNGGTKAKSSTKKTTTSATKKKATATTKRKNVAAVSAKAKKKATGAGTAKAKRDDLKKVEGIGPKIEGLLHAAKITTFKKLSETKISVIKAILEKAGPRYQMHDPATWPKQAGMAAKGDWAKLQKWQDAHNGGRKK